LLELESFEKHFKKQYAALRAMSVEKRVVLAVVPTGFGKSLILLAMFDFIRSGCAPGEGKQYSTVIAVSLLNALMRDQLQILGGVLNVVSLKRPTLFRTTNVGTGK